MAEAVSTCYSSVYNSGARRDRTADLLLAKHSENTPVFTDLANFWEKVHRFAVFRRWISPN